GERVLRGRRGVAVAAEVEREYVQPRADEGLRVRELFAEVAAALVSENDRDRARAGVDRIQAHVVLRLEPERLSLDSRGRAACARERGRLVDGRFRLGRPCR